MIHTLTYTEDLPETWMGAATSGWMIRIRPRYRDDRGILEHELTHVGQFWVAGSLGTLLLMTLGILAGDVYGVPLWSLCPLGMGAHPVLYWLSAFYRPRCEVDAYKVQAACYSDDRRAVFAGFIADPKRYGLKITAPEAERLLRS